jgi:hypothetical protein
VFTFLAICYTFSLLLLAEVGCHWIFIVQFVRFGIG